MNLHLHYTWVMAFLEWLNFKRGAMLFALAVAFFYFVWPTPWHYYTYEGYLHRTNRFSGAHDVAMDGRWLKWE